MGRLPKEEANKRNALIRKLAAQGLTYHEISKQTRVQEPTIHRILKKTGNTVRYNTISRSENMHLNAPRPFRAHLEVGQTVILRAITRNQQGKIVVKSEKKYTVAGIYPWHVRFERPGSNGNVIVKDYVWADLRYRLKMKGERVAC
jgi:hypothetical protein